mmetsp:Transcript_49124/g.116990  ORF Transcript_49124/g.116990 Transcript_49124/m.116990 type:complete len:471 (-) Transcript_49124:325-1737(-)
MAGHGQWEWGGGKQQKRKLPQPVGGPRPLAMKGPVRPSASPHAIQHRPVQQYSQQPADPEPLIKWMELAFEDPLVAERGLSHVAPALVYNQDYGSLLSSASWILEDLVGGKLDIPDNFELHHDEGWTQFPGVAVALQQVEAPELSFCVAMCPAKDLWGVGLGNKWKQREAAAKLALCVALTWNIGDDFDMVAEKHTEFGAFCEDEGYIRPGGSSQSKSRKRVYGGPHTDWGHSAGELSESLVAAMERAAQGKSLEPPSQATLLPEQIAPPRAPPAGKASTRAFTKQEVAAEDAAEQPEAVLEATGEVRKETAHWIQVPDSESLPPLLDGLPRDAPVLSTDGTKRKALYAKVDEALKAILSDPDNEVEYHDDPDWLIFPSIGAELKKLGDKEECMGVAVCLSRAVWAVGIGMKWRSRNAAARVALVAAMVQQAQEIGDAVDISNFTALSEFADEAATAKALLDTAGVGLGI